MLDDDDKTYMVPTDGEGAYVIDRDGVCVCVCLCLCLSSFVIYYH